MRRRTEAVSRLSYRIGIGLLTGAGLLSLADALFTPASRTQVSLISLLAAGLTFAAIVLLLRLRERIKTKLDEWDKLRRRNALELRQDELTGSLTRSTFIAGCTGRLKSQDFVNGLLLHIDLDHLKQINDGQGHDAGDAALRRLGVVGQRLAPRGLFGRLGGDEFAIFLEGDAAGPAFATEFLGELARPFWHNGRLLKLSASIGIAPVDPGEGCLDEAMKRADLALYESKRRGRSQFTVYEREMMVDYKHVRFMERELRAAILLSQLELEYQPVFEIDGQIRGWEALVRWRHPVRGRIPPSDFVPIAEQSLLIDMLGEWVLRKACAHLGGLGDRLIGVNFSASQLKRDDVVSMVARVLEEAGIPAERIVIEITESVSLNPTEDVLRRLRELRAMGVRISLDDFGTGFCGFAYLRSFPVELDQDRPGLCRQARDQRGRRRAPHRALQRRARHGSGRRRGRHRNGGAAASGQGRGLPFLPGLSSRSASSARCARSGGDPRAPAPGWRYGDAPDRLRRALRHLDSARQQAGEACRCCRLIRVKADRGRRRSLPLHALEIPRKARSKAGGPRRGGSAMSRIQGSGTNGETPAAARRNDAAASRALVVYYSHSGYTRRVARAVAEQLGAALGEIRCARYSSGGLGRLRATFDSVLRRVPPIAAPPEVDQDWDTVVIAAPVWAGRPATPMVSLLRRGWRVPQNVGLLLTHFGSPPDKAFAEMEALLRVKPSARLAVRDKDIDSGAATAAVSSFVSRLRETRPA